MIKNDFPKKKSIGLLLDPDKITDDSLRVILGVAVEYRADYILAGGSITFNSIDHLIGLVKGSCSIPVILFPGNLLQLSLKADAILLLSLISGRNSELLIGNHVIAAPYLRSVKERLISVGYILIGCGTKTSVEYISQTEAIPADKYDIVVATALAGEMLGLRMIYLEAGSGSVTPVPAGMIKAVRENVQIPIAVGGGLKKGLDIRNAFEAGADLIILGNGCEKNPDLLAEACRIRDSLRGQPST